MALDLTWLGCDLVSGKIIEELPDLTPKSGSLTATLATATSAQFSLPIPLGGTGAAPRDWQSATQEADAMIVAVLAGTPIWAGAVLVNDRGTAATAELACVSLEGYLDRRYVGDHTWTGQDEASVIAAGLLADANVEGIGLVIDAPATGTLRDRTYADRDDKTVYSALRELMGVMNGPEWTIALDWTDSTQTAVRKTARVRKRIGVGAAIPNAVFDAQSSAVFDSAGTGSTQYRVVRDYSAGKGANHIVAVSSGQGDSRPQSSPARAEALIAGGMPRWEYRWTPSTSITDTTVLDAHAQSALQLKANGARSITITARADIYPLLGRDWAMGDDIGYNLAGHGHPDGLLGVARAVGWQLNPVQGTVSPIILAIGDEVI
ncbi:MAG: hypothetical protein ACJ72N_19810 [Labedaea sp.]